MRTSVNASAMEHFGLSESSSFMTCVRQTCWRCMDEIDCFVSIQLSRKNRKDLISDLFPALSLSSYSGQAEIIHFHGTQYE